MNDTIKEILNISELEDSDYSLVKWHNEVINKPISKLDEEDIAKMLRQKMFLDIAVEKAIDILKENPFSGMMYAGEVLESILMIDEEMLRAFASDLKEVIKIAEKNADSYSWGYAEEKDEYLELVLKLKKVVKD